MRAAPAIASPPARVPGWQRALGMLVGDPFALVSLLFLIALVLAAAIGPELLTAETQGMNLQMRNAPPFTLDHGIAYVLGADALGRPILPRLLVAARTTLLVSVAVVLCSMLAGALLGLIAGFYGRFLDSMIMRAADVIMSFPSLLLAVIVLYVLEPRVTNVVIVLAITRIPVYVRVARAEVLEVRERLFVEAASLDFAGVMLAESSLSFLGIGVQPPNVTWGLMVATGRNYLTTAWWLAFWPGLAIMLTALATNLLSNWLRIAMDPRLRWRLESVPEVKADA
jgi:peptide/nickel transport system permease protein